MLKKDNFALLTEMDAVMMMEKKSRHGFTSQRKATVLTAVAFLFYVLKSSTFFDLFLKTLPSFFLHQEEAGNNRQHLRAS